MQEFAMLVESWFWQALSERISYVLRACALDEFHSSVPYHVSQEMNVRAHQRGVSARG